MELKVNFKLGGIGAILTAVFAVLKLTGVVSWSWLVCFLPLIIGAGLTLALFGAMFVIMFCAIPDEVKKDLKKERERSREEEREERKDRRRAKRNRGTR